MQPLSPGAGTTDPSSEELYDVDTCRAEYLEAQLQGDRRRALALVGEMLERRGLSGPVIRRQVIGAAQREIGQLWQQNRISIAQEHMATAISHLALADLFQRDHGTAANGRKVIVACVEGELHEFPARLVADELDLAGFAVRFLGADVPLDTLLSFVAREQPDLVVISATMVFHADQVRKTVERLSALFPGVPVAIGGQVCEWIEPLGAEVGAAISGCDVATLVSKARALLRVS